jgi:CheY-like chemotaxis protein
MATILYVEDHPPAQMLMQAIVGEMTGHTLHMANTGEMARAIASEAEPDLYILDLDLPDTDGLALAEMLSQLHPAPVILVSAYAEAVKDAESGDLITMYLAKPLDPDHVVEAIQRALA